MKQKNFKEIYEDIYVNIGTEMELKRKNALIKSILIFVVFLLVFFIMYNSKSLIKKFFLLIFLVIFFMFFIKIIIRKIYKNYTVFYKEKIISEIVKKSNSNMRYFYNRGIAPSEYVESSFNLNWDRFSTEDLIKGTLEDGSNVKMAQVRTEIKHTSTDSEGHTTTSYVTNFLGLYGIIKLNINTNVDFKILNNSKFDKFNKNRIEMESSEFEKYYDVFSGGKNFEIRQNTMEILTPEAIEEFVKIRNLFKKEINVRVCYDKIYFRIAVGDIFEAPTLKSSLNFEMLYRYFLIIDVPRMLYETLIDNIIVMHGDKQDRENRLLEKMSEKQREEYLKNKKEE